MWYEIIIWNVVEESKTMILENMFVLWEWYGGLMDNTCILG